MEIILRKFGCSWQSFFINETMPGSDLAGETAAALAAGSIIFKDLGILAWNRECEIVLESLDINIG